MDVLRPIDEEAKNLKPFIDEMEYLVQQTIELNDKLKGLSPFDDKAKTEEDQLSLFDNVHSSVEEKSEDPEYFEDLSYNGPGVVYRVDNGVSTFCIRSIACANISKVLEGISSGDAQYLKTLKLDDEETEVEEYLVQYYPTEFLETAELITETLANQRLPKLEDQLCNLSDPGFSWWMEDFGHSFKIYFQSRGIAQKNGCFKLGPLGDPGLAVQMFIKFRSEFDRIFSLAEYSIDSTSFSIGTNMNQMSDFENFKNIFKRGLVKDFLELINRDSTLYYYLSEMGELRKFWIEIEEQLNDQETLLSSTPENTLIH